MRISGALRMFIGASLLHFAHARIGKKQARNSLIVLTKNRVKISHKKTNKKRLFLAIVFVTY